MKKTGGRNLDESQEEQELSALMRKTQSGDSGAYRELLGRLVVLLRANVQNSLSRMGLADAASVEDVVQEILLAVHGKRDTYDPSQYFLPWLYAIARYKVIDFGRRAKVVKAQGLQEFDETQILPEDVLDRDGKDEASDRIDLRDELERLPRKQREILTLAKVEGLSLEEISIQTGFSLSDVKVSVHRAIKTLKKNFKERDSENR